MRAQLLHLSGPKRGVTATYEGPEIAVGSSPRADVRFRATSGVAPAHALITYDDCGCDFMIRAVDGEVFVDHQQVREAILKHGDLIEFGAGGPKARFRVWQKKGAPCKPVRSMLVDAASVRRESGALAGGSTLIRDLLTQATLTLKVGFAVLLAGALILAFAGGWFGGGRAAEERVHPELEALRAELAELRAQQTERVTREEIDKIRAELAGHTADLERVAGQQAVVKTVMEELALGVCLIHGTWGFLLPESLRTDELEFFETPDGTRVELEYTGSGFHVGDGQIVTNRHVALPWETVDEIAGMLRNGFEPVMFRLTATFPGHPPSLVDPGSAIVRPDDTIDVAVLVVDVPKSVPVLELDERPADELAGETVLVVGYPTGVNALLAKADDAVARNIVDSASGDLGQIIASLADAAAISPVVTRGVLSEVRAAKLVYDAETTSGGSGGPVFGSNGKVIGVNFAILSGFGGTNFGVPANFARELLD